MFKRTFVSKSSTYIEIEDTDFHYRYDEDVVIIWCPNDQMAIFIHREMKLTTKQRLIKRLEKKKRCYYKKLTNLFKKNSQKEADDDMDFWCCG
ncbi:10900_t:CDS:2 [Dentiscutata heterogama]|uniref:10900_t:CDS:1 n=1 Tax=Dentiscutata heterogama TaxID=1316150 RepID=A0ACA9P4L8_9GLOM|nr:10900_t:CDS:2 [Dentiscutata heterogama]